MDANGVNTVLSASGKVLETVPEAYNDVLQPAAKETGKTISLIPRAINAALIPLQKWIIHKEYSLKEVEVLLEQKLKNIEVEKIVTPEPYVAVPTLQAISYCMDCEELRDMFANLLSKSMNSDTKNNVHPSFSEIIKQLSPLDANILRLFSRPKPYPIAEYKLVLPKYAGEAIVYTNVFLDYTRSNFNLVAASLTNLERLGLLKINYNSFMKDENIYDKFYNDALYIQLQQRISISDDQTSIYEKADIGKGMVSSTPLGKNFINICILSF